MQKLSCLTTPFFILLASNPSYTQCSLAATAFEDLFAPGTTVVEARVKSAASFWGSAGEMIYTRYELEVYQVFKGNARRSVDLVALGGVVGDAAIQVAPFTGLQVNDVGLFALKPSVYDLPRGYGQTLQSVVPQGAIVTYDPTAEEAYLLNGKTMSRAAVCEAAASAAGRSPVRVREFPAPALNRSMVPQIDSITPEWVAAGVGEVITIHGANFGEGTGTIFFRDADRGGAGIHCRSSVAYRFLDDDSY